MERKSILLICIGLALAAGLGYAGGYRQANDDALAEKKSRIPVSRAPRFGESKKIDSRQDEEKTLDPSTLQDLAQRIYPMTAEQIRTEINRLDQDRYQGNFDTKKNISLLYLAYRWGQLAPQQALAYAESLQMTNELVVPQIMQGWIESHPETAALYFLQNRYLFSQIPEILGTLAARLGEKDPGTALKWSFILDSSDRKKALPFVMSGIAAAHPDQLQDSLALLSAEDLKNKDLCNKIAEGWAAHDWTAAKSWVHTLPASLQRDAFNAALWTLAQNNPDGATTEYAQLKETEKTTAAHFIVDSIANNSPREAVEWVQKNIDNENALHFEFDIIGDTHNQIPTQEFQEYVTLMPGGNLRDALLDRTVTQIMDLSDKDSIDYSDLLSLSFAIFDEKKRKEAANNVLTSWCNNFPEKAREEIRRNSYLSREQKDNFEQLCLQILDARKKGQGR